MILASGLAFTLPFLGCVAAIAACIPSMTRADATDTWPFCAVCGEQITGDDYDDRHTNGDDEFHEACCPDPECQT